MLPYRRLPSLLCRRFPNRRGVVNSGIVGKSNGSQAGRNATQQTGKSAVPVSVSSPIFNHARRRGRRETSDCLVLRRGLENVPFETGMNWQEKFRGIFTVTSRVGAVGRGARRGGNLGGILRAVILVVALGFSGCSARKYAINQLGNALANSGTTFSGDDDPELVRGAVPFSLKLIESLLAETPQHRGLLLAAASGFTQYSFAFVAEEADELEEKDLAATNALRARARKLYTRARNYGLRGLAAAHPGFEKSLRADPKTAVAQLTKGEVALAYWTAASWGALIGISKDNPEILADQLIVEALLDRVLTLDEAFGGGAIHQVLIQYELARQGGAGDAVERARKHFDRAVSLAGGKQAGPFVAWAETVSVKNQNAAEFKKLLEEALAVNVDAQPEHRLENLIMQRRARWLLSRVDDLFLPAEPAATPVK